MNSLNSIELYLIHKLWGGLPHAACTHTHTDTASQYAFNSLMYNKFILGTVAEHVFTNNNLQSSHETE